MAAPGWVHAWEAAGRASAPRAGLSVSPPRALWFLDLWHLVMVSTWAWRGAEKEAEDEEKTGEEEGEEGGRWAASAAVRGVACGAGAVTEAASGAEGDWGDMLTGTEDGSVLGGAAAPGGAEDEGVRWPCGRGEASPGDCAG